MTSSLVGSEMCIRDRKYTIQFLMIPCRDNMAPTTVGCMLLREVQTAHDSCLLYTSDADDDM
eukprot:10130529-Prorocentrum_lima.AAC.1